MTTKKLGGQTAALACPPSLLSFANVVGKKEGEGPLAACFDYVDTDDAFGASTWEQSERAMQQKALTLALEKAGPGEGQLDWLFAGASVPPLPPGIRRAPSSGCTAPAPPWGRVWPWPP